MTLNDEDDDMLETLDNISYIPLSILYVIIVTSMLRHHFTSVLSNAFQYFQHKTM